MNKALKTEIYYLNSYSWAQIFIFYSFIIVVLLLLFMPIGSWLGILILVGLMVFILRYKPKLRFKNKLALTISDDGICVESMDLIKWQNVIAVNINSKSVHFRDSFLELVYFNKELQKVTKQVYLGYLDLSAAAIQELIEKHTGQFKVGNDIYD